MADLLLIDDDKNLTELLGAFLNKNGHSIQVAADGNEGIRLLYQTHPSLVILDVTMPKLDGWETLARIREISDTPVIMLTSRSEEPDILRGFSNGADDYVTKPFSFAQMAARIQAVLSRSTANHDEPQAKIEEGDLLVDFRTKQVTRSGENISLTPTEFKLLTTLMGKSGEVVSPEELVKEVWGPQYAGEIGHVRRYIWHLRKKIEPDPEDPHYIHNDRGYGYRFQVI
ncbi:MAG: response regulator transcription factor [Anaerolineae bacterium]|nr:response regulator transcription factor [Anaerolineae bacterium]